MHIVVEKGSQMWSSTKISLSLAASFPHTCIQQYTCTWFFKGAENGKKEKSSLIKTHFGPNTKTLSVCLSVCLSVYLAWRRLRPDYFILFTFYLFFPYCGYTRYKKNRPLVRGNVMHKGIASGGTTKGQGIFRVVVVLVSTCFSDIVSWISFLLLPLKLACMCAVMLWQLEDRY